MEFVVDMSQVPPGATFSGGQGPDGARLCFGSQPQQPPVAWKLHAAIRDVGLLRLVCDTAALLDRRKKSHPVPPDGSIGQAGAGGDFFIGEAIGQQLQDLPFTTGKPFHLGGRGERFLRRMRWSAKKMLDVRIIVNFVFRGQLCSMIQT